MTYLKSLCFHNEEHPSAHGHAGERSGGKGVWKCRIPSTWFSNIIFSFADFHFSQSYTFCQFTEPNSSQRLVLKRSNSGLHAAPPPPPGQCFLQNLGLPKPTLYFLIWNFRYFWFSTAEHEELFTFLTSDFHPWLCPANMFWILSIWA